MNSKNVNNYENVVIRKEQEIGINNFGLEYLVSLEQEIERLNNITNEVRVKLYDLNYKIKEIYNVPFDVSEIFEMIEILDKSGSDKE